MPTLGPRLHPRWGCVTQVPVRHGAKAELAAENALEATALPDLRFRSRPVRPLHELSIGATSSGTAASLRRRRAGEPTDAPIRQGGSGVVSRNPPTPTPRRRACLLGLRDVRMASKSRRAQRRWSLHHLSLPYCGTSVQQPVFTHDLYLLPQIVADPPRLVQTARQSLQD